MKLVYSFVSKQYPTYIHDEDIIQCGMVGLCKAAERWDESKSQFSTFAWMCIKNEILLEFRRRAKHQGVLSLDYEVDNGEGGTCSFGDIIAGDEDVPYYDVDINPGGLNQKERCIAGLLHTDRSQADIAREVGCSRPYVWKTIRKIRALRGYANESK